MANGRAWTTDDTATLRRLVSDGMTAIQIGALMGRNPKLVDTKRRGLGLEPGQSGRHTAMMARINYRRRTETM